MCCANLQMGKESDDRPETETHKLEQNTKERRESYKRVYIKKRRIHSLMCLSLYAQARI